MESDIMWYGGWLVALGWLVATSARRTPSVRELVQRARAQG